MLAEAMPALEASLKALDTLKKDDITEMKGYTVPPKEVEMCLEAVMILKEHKGAKDWKASVLMMKDPKKFLDDLKNFAKDSIKEKTLKSLKKYINDDRFVPPLVEKKSLAGKSICMWVRAMDKYAEVKKIVEPKEKALKKAEIDLKVANDDLNIK